MTAKNSRPTYLTDEVIAAFKAADYMRLHRALGLHPWQHSPLPDEITALGVDQDDPPDYMDAHQCADWRAAQALQRKLLKVAGWPDCRQAYRDNLAEVLADAIMPSATCRFRRPEHYAARPLAG